MNEQARILRQSIRALVRRFSVGERADVSCCGMTVAQAATLEALSVSGPTRLGELGRSLGIQPSTLTRNLARLEQRGLIQRVPVPGDGRATAARLTESGRGAAAEIEEQTETFAVDVLARLSPERRKAVVAGLGELLQAVQEATRECCPGAFEHLVEIESDAERSPKC